MYKALEYEDFILYEQAELKNNKKMNTCSKSLTKIMEDIKIPTVKLTLFFYLFYKYSCNII